VIDRALDVLFPRSCAGCAEGAWPFCERCTAELEPLGPPWCRRCGRPTPSDVDRCRDCPPATIASARAAFAYRGPAREAVHRLKFSGWRGVGEALAGALVTLGPPAADAVTWVPLAPRRRAERGFDQAQVLARALARQLDLPSSAFVRRRSAAGTQARRARDERFAAMAGAFVPLGRGGPSPPTLLLVDDVLTTGATASACAAALADAGARTVHLMTACRSFSDRRRDLAGRGGPTRLPILEIVLPSGSVVARGTTPVVDASRGRNDPRKTTVGRRAWSGLEVSPAPYGRGCESVVGGIASGRRRTSPQASVGEKTRSAGREHTPSLPGATLASSTSRGGGDRRWT
jgi:ComF family protein